MEHAHRPATDDQHVLAKADVRAIDAVDHAGERLGERHPLPVRLVLIDDDVLGVGDDVLGEPAISRNPVRILEDVGGEKVLADVLVAGLAVVALLAVVDDVVHDSLAKLEALLVDGVAHLGDDASVLVATDAGIGIGAVTLVVAYVIRAYASDHHADEHLIVCDLRTVDLGESDVAWPGHYESLHH